ncbi:MAG: dockerin type I domain-containing protein [Acutalibacteraceae bacterium]
MKNTRRILSYLLVAVMLITLIPVASINASAASTVVESAISWAISIANDNSHGYSQSSRWGPDYDCSSFVISAFKSAGVDTGTATYTGNMRSQFTQHGFQWIPWSQIGGVSNLQRGDILLNEVSHTEIYLGNNQNVGAHSNRGYPQTGDQTGTEVSVSGYYYHPWDGVLRYAGSNPCTCSTDYAGDYIVNTSSQDLNMRNAHGGGSVITTIPKGTQVYVSKSDGTWAHVEWNGYSGYCSMAYLKKIENKNYNLHVWVSDTAMGSVPSDFYKGNRYYICYELIDATTGKKANETSNIRFKATETVRNSSGIVFEYTYENDNNWISFVCDAEDTYTGTVTISGDVDASCSVSFEAWAKTAAQIKTWAWEGDESNGVSTIGVGTTVYISYLIRDKYTQRNLNDVTTLWTTGNGYTVTVEVYSPSGALVKSNSYKNKDCAWIDFKPSVIGKYKIVTKVSGNLAGSYEKSFTCEEKEHIYGSWTITNAATCTSSGTKTRICSICGNKETQTIAATGHSYGSWVTTTTATCTSSGTKTRTCSICGKKETQTIAATGHSYSSWVTTTTATCTSSGTKTRTCSICGKKETQTIAATGHKYTEKVVSPTTNEQGYTLHTCTVCGDSYKDNYTDPVKPVDPNAPQIVVDSKTASPGSKVTVNVSLKNNPGIWGMDLAVNYDKSVLTLDNVTNGAVFSSSEWTPGNIKGDKYNLSYEASGFDNVKTNGIIATLEFTVNPNAKVGSSINITVNYNPGDIINSSSDNINPDVVSGEIKILNFIYGDVNSDGVVNKKDSLMLKRYLADNTVKIDKKAADVNADNSVNKKDSLRLKQYLAGWNVKLG